MSKTEQHFLIGLISFAVVMHLWLCYRLGGGGGGDNDVNRRHLQLCSTKSQTLPKAFNCRTKEIPRINWNGKDETNSDKQKSVVDPWIFNCLTELYLDHAKCVDTSLNVRWDSQVLHTPCINIGKKCVANGSPTHLNHLSESVKNNKTSAII